MALRPVLWCLASLGLVGCTGFRAREPSPHAPLALVSCEGKKVQLGPIPRVKEAYLVGKHQLQAHLRVRGCTPRPIEVCWWEGEYLTTYPLSVQFYVLPTPEEQACSGPFTTQVFDIALEFVPEPLARCAPYSRLDSRILCGLSS